MPQRAKTPEDETQRCPRPARRRPPASR
jgi:hypothetical protein